MRFELAFQLRRCVFDFSVPILLRSGFHRKQTASVNVHEISVRKLVSALRIHRVTFVNTQMPLRVLVKPVPADELVFRIRRWFVPAPRAFVIGDQMSSLDELRRERDGMFVQLDAAIRLGPGITDRVETNNEPDQRYANEFADDCFHSRQAETFASHPEMATVFGSSGRSSAW